MTAVAALKQQQQQTVEVGHSLDQGMRQGEYIPKSGMRQTGIKFNAMEGTEVRQFLAAGIRRIATKTAQGADPHSQIDLQVGMGPEVTLKDWEVVTQVMGHKDMLIKLGR